MDFKDFTASENDNDRRLDKILRNFLDNKALSEVYKLIRKGLIKVNHKKSKPEYHVVTGDVISIAEFLLNQQDEKNNYTSLPMPQIVFENENILIINKPYNVNVHGEGETLDKAIQNYYQSKYENNSLSFTPGPLHRLDRKTTGLLAFSFSLKGAHWFSEKIQTHEIQKKYFGLVEGKLEKTELWKDYIKNNENDSGFSKVTASSQKDSESKEAITKASPVAYGIYNSKPVTLVQFDIETGRKHQIRSQSSLHNHPLLGDTAYGGNAIKNNSRDFYLQAYELNIGPNPLELPEKITIELDKDFEELLNRCGIKNIRV